MSDDEAAVIDYLLDGLPNPSTDELFGVGGRVMSASHPLPAVGAVVSVRGAPGEGRPDRSATWCRAEVLAVETREHGRSRARVYLGAPYHGWVAASRVRAL